MINLRTGTPGACKTLSAVEALAKLVGRWEKHPAEARPIFVHGVKDLALPHSPLPTVEWKEAQNKPVVSVPDWDAMPDGSFVLIDEAQSFFPPRSSAATPPPHVAWLNTHRHRGFDIELITQHPKLIDGSVRALIGKHQHYRRLFGGQRAYCYEWDACSDSLSGLGSAVGRYYPFPKSAFRWYKSAEVHTKQRFSMPKWFLIPVIGIAIGLIAIPRAYSVIAGGIGGKGLPGSSVASAAPGLAPPASAVALATASEPAKGVVREVRDAIVPPVIAGCMATAKRCACVDEHGAMAKVDDAACRVASETLGGLVPYDVVPHAVAARDASVPRPVVPLASQMPAEANRFEGSTTLAPRRPQSTLSVVQSRMP